MARHHNRHALRPGDTSRLSRSSLFVQLRLKCGLDGGHVQLVLAPTDDDFGGQVGVGDDVALRLLQADAAVCRAGVGAIGGGNGPVHGQDNAVSRVAVAGGDGPGVGGGHGGGR